MTKNKNVNNLINDGFVHLENYIPKDEINELINTKMPRVNKDCVSETFELSPDKKEKIFFLFFFVLN